MAGLSSSTFMQRHGVGVNSTGMYIISGIPQTFDIAAGVNGDVSAAWKPFESLSREVTIVVWDSTGNADHQHFATISFDDAGRNAAGEVQNGAPANSFKLRAGTTITLPIRAAGIRVGTTANIKVSVIATLTGLAPHDDVTKYPRLKGDGKLTPQPHREGA